MNAPAEIVASESIAWRRVICFDFIRATSFVSSSEFVQTQTTPRAEGLFSLNAIRFGFYCLVEPDILLNHNSKKRIRRVIQPLPFGIVLLVGQYYNG